MVGVTAARARNGLTGVDAGDGGAELDYVARRAVADWGLHSELTVHGLARAPEALPGGPVQHLADQIRPLPSLADQGLAGQLHAGPLGAGADHGMGVPHQHRSRRARWNGHVTDDGESGPVLKDLL